jgi:hypothetical protein
MNLRNLTSAWAGLLAVIAAGTGMARAQEAVAPTEYEVKAAFLYNFAKFVEWPAEAFPATNTPITIGIVGKNPFDGVLERSVRNKAIRGRDLIVQQMSSGADPAFKRCHIIFISAGEKGRFAEILENLKDTHALTVSEADGFLKSGGMVNFVMEGKKVRFEINDAAAAKAGVRISSKLLNLAKKTEAGQ